MSKKNFQKQEQTRGTKKQSNRRSNRPDNKSNNSKRDFANGERNSKSVSEDMPHVITTSKTSNASSWYTHVYPLVDDYASLPFNIPVGTGFNPVSRLSSEFNADEVEMSTVWAQAKVVQGIMTLRTAPVPGVATDPTSPVNMAAQQIYTLDRKANSGATNYDKTDVMMVMLAMDSAYMLYEELLRAYRLFSAYDYMSRYLPDDVLYALGYSPKLSEQYSDFRGLLDLFAYKLASVNVPDQFDFIQRHSWLYTNIYADSDSPKAQLFAYIPDGYHIWTEADGDNPAYLKYYTREQLFGTSQVSTVAQIRQAINKIMNPILGSQDVGTISGDLAKAFGENGMIKIAPVSEHEMLKPAYNMEVLQQMMNSIVVGSCVNNSLDIKQNLDDLVSGPYLVCQPVVEYNIANTVNAMSKKMFNLTEQNNPELVLTSSRLMTVLSDSMGMGAPGISITSCGTEIVTQICLWSKNFTSEAPDKLIPDTEPTALVLNSNFITAATQVSDIQRLLTLASAVSQYDHAPTLYGYVVSSGPNHKTVSLAGTIQDIQNYVLVENSTIENLNNVAVMSEFAVKDYGTGVSN